MTFVQDLIYSIRWHFSERPWTLKFSLSFPLSMLQTQAQVENPSIKLGITSFVSSFNQSGRATPMLLEHYLPSSNDAGLLRRLN
jgi:hypothetical protein